MITLINTQYGFKIEKKYVSFKVQFKFDFSTLHKIKVKENCFNILFKVNSFYCGIAGR